MPSPKTVLPWLLGGGIGLAGVLQGLHWKHDPGPAVGTAAAVLEGQLRKAMEENELLKRENESLRSLAQGGGEFSVPHEWISRVEREYELKFLSSPVVHRIAAEELRDRITASIENRLGPAGIDLREEAYALIGWIGMEDRLLGQLAALRSVGARSWFDEVSGEGWVTGKFDLEQIPDQAALLRVLTRILFFQNFPPPPAYPGDEMDRARTALHQGTASGTEARFFAESARTIGFLPLNEDSAAEALLRSLPEFLQGLTMFPLIEGKNFADGYYLKGAAALNDRFRDPPLSTREILESGREPPEKIEFDLPERAEEPFLTENAGQLGLRLWLQPLGDAGIAENVARHWRGDRYALVPDGDSQSAVIWDIEMDSPESCEGLLASAGDLLAANTDAAARVGTDQAVETPVGRYVMLQRLSATRVRFTHSVEPTKW